MPTLDTRVMYAQKLVKFDQNQYSKELFSKMTSQSIIAILPNMMHQNSFLLEKRHPKNGTSRTCIYVSYPPGVQGRASTVKYLTLFLFKGIGKNNRFFIHTVRLSCPKQPVFGTKVKFSNQSSFPINFSKDSSFN